MQRALDAAAADYGKEYGVDYIVLGYKRPLAATIRAAINDAWGAWKADINGTNLNNLPLMADFRSIKEDCHMIVVMNSGSPGAGNWYLMSARLQNRVQTTPMASSVLPL